MGMNYYVREKETGCVIHLGKRSAAGFYCWKCGMSNSNYSRVYMSSFNYKEPHILYGIDAVHYSDSNKLEININDEPSTMNKCPICNTPFFNDDKINSAYAELGLCSQPNKEKQTTCSFSFAVTPFMINKYLYEDCDKYDFFNEIKNITRYELIDVIQNCGIKYFNTINTNFS